MTGFLRGRILNVGKKDTDAVTLAGASSLSAGS